MVGATAEGPLVAVLVFVEDASLRHEKRFFIGECQKSIVLQS